MDNRIEPSCPDVPDSLKSNPSGEQTESATDLLFKILEQKVKELAGNSSVNAPETDVLEDNSTAAAVLTDCLKQLRLNITQECLCEYVLGNAERYFPILDTLMQYLFTKKNASAPCTKYFIHVLINILTTSNEEENIRRSILMQKYICKDFIHAFFYNAYGCFHEVSALLYNMYRGLEMEDIALVEAILLHDFDSKTSNEYTGFLVELIMSQKFVWQNYGQLGQKARLALQDSLQDKFITDGQGMNKISDECLGCLRNTFNTSINVVFQVDQENDLFAIRQVAQVLENLGHASSVEKFLPLLQNDTDLLVNAGVLLINVHRLGKSPNNIFTPVQKLSAMQSGEQTLGCPVTGFKADLVRLIGNLCWKSRKMQDLAREGDLIPVLLDTCNIDAKNPFIMQWAILTLRNLCENNQENQAIIAGLTKQGMVSSDAMQELGLTLHAEDDRKIGIMRLGVSE